MGNLCLQSKPSEFLDQKLFFQPIDTKEDLNKCAFVLPFLPKTGEITFVLLNYETNEPLVYISITSQEKQRTIMVLDTITMILKHSILHIYPSEKIVHCYHLLALSDGTTGLDKPQEISYDIQTIINMNSRQASFVPNEAYAIFVDPRSQKYYSYSYPIADIKKLAMVSKVFFPIDGWRIKTKQFGR